MHQTGTKHIVRHMQRSVVQLSVISKFTCISSSIIFISIIIIIIMIIISPWTAVCFVQDLLKRWLPLQMGIEESDEVFVCNVEKVANLAKSSMQLDLLVDVLHTQVSLFNSLTFLSVFTAMLYAYALCKKKEVDKMVTGINLETVWIR